VKILFTIETLLLLTFSYSFAQGNLDTWDHLKKEKFQIKYPPSWEINEAGMMGTSLILLSPISNAEDTFRENVNLIVQDLSAYPLTLVEYTELSISQIKTMIQNGALISSNRIEGRMNQFQKVMYTGKQGLFDLKFLQYYFIHEQSAYVLTFTAEIDKFDKYETIGAQILDSFKFAK